MGVRYEWADDNHIIMNIYLEAPWSWDEFNQMIREMMPLLKEVDHPCATVVEMTQIGSLPRDGNLIQILRDVDRKMPENVFASAVVGAPYGITVFMNMLTKLSPHAKRVALFSYSMETAYETIMDRYREIEKKP
jgi:hypothetical protein